MSPAELEWRLRRLSRMSASEVGWRLSDQLRRIRWSSRQVSPDAPTHSWASGSLGHLAAAGDPGTHRVFHDLPLHQALQSVPDATRARVIAAGDEILDGRWQLLGAVRWDMEDPDWFFDPVTGRRAPQTDYCFKVNHRSEDVTGNVKQVWELSRLHHLTVLGACFALSGEARYAERAAAHLRSWWRQNPFLSGVHWTSGIEAGLRLITWVWVRRLLQDWPGAGTLFERNPVALAQIWWHQHYLACFRSRGSSANNHVIAEAAGLLVGALAFDWFDESPRWARDASRVLEQELVNNTFPSGIDREMASDYHGFVAELAAVAAVESDWAGHPLSPGLWTLLYEMLDVMAATVDVKLRGPRQGDGDNGAALVLDPSPAVRWSEPLAIGEALFDTPSWWPAVTPSVVSGLLASMTDRRCPAPSPRRRSHFSDAGLTLMRSSPAHGEEIWCRCDAGPHGFLSIAAHAHADALAVEVRFEGTDILADPGTYCYHGEPEWRAYFRSTLAHNTIAVSGQDQSTSGGPFLWTRHARTQLLGLETDEQGDVISWSAEHDGYRSLTPPVTHRRSVRMDSRCRRLEITDELATSGTHQFQMVFHLGPDVLPRMVGRVIELSWPQGADTRSAVLSLPEGPAWSMTRGQEDPLLGWYSPRFGEKRPAWAVTGTGVCGGAGSDCLRTVLQFQGPSGLEAP